MLNIVLILLIVSAVALYFLSGKLFKKELKCSIVHIGPAPSPKSESESDVETSTSSSPSSVSSGSTSPSPGPSN